MLAGILEHAENVEMGNILRSEYSCHGCVCPRYPAVVCILDLGLTPHSTPGEGKLTLARNKSTSSVLDETLQLGCSFAAFNFFIVPANV